MSRRSAALSAPMRGHGGTGTVGARAGDDSGTWRRAPVTVARSGRFAGERAPAFVALNSSLALDWRLWPEDIEGSVAHARALPARGRAERRRARGHRERPRRASAARSRPAPSCPRDADEDVHMAVERRLTELIGDAGAKLHTGRSRNDQVVTDVRLHLRRVVERQDAALRALQELLLARAADHLETVLPAYTHLQRAQVTSLAQHLLAYFWMLERDRDTVRGGPRTPASSCRSAPAPPWASNFDLDREAVAAELGFERVARELARRGRRPRLRGRLPGRRGAARRRT